MFLQASTLSSTTSLLSVIRPHVQVAERQGSMAPIGVPHVALPSESVQMSRDGAGLLTTARNQPSGTAVRSRTVVPLPWVS